MLGDLLHKLSSTLVIAYVGYLLGYIDYPSYRLIILAIAASLNTISIIFYTLQFRIENKRFDNL